MPPLPEGESADADVVHDVTAPLVEAVSTTRAAIEQAAEYDAVTEDLLHQVVQSLEEHSWMFSTQRER